MCILSSFTFRNFHSVLFLFSKCKVILELPFQTTHGYLARIRRDSEMRPHPNSHSRKGHAHFKMKIPALDSKC